MVAIEAMSDLRRSPPTDQESREGPAVLDAPFLNRFERFAEEASTEQLRQRWGRILAAEVRKPGTFSQKTLRLVDELSSQDAQTFEKICGKRLGNMVPLSICQPDFDELNAMISAGLLIDPGFGIQQPFEAGTGSDGSSWWRMDFGNGRDFVLSDAGARKMNGMTAYEPAGNYDEGIGMAVNLLTPEGLALSSIIDDRQAEAFEAYIGSFRPYLQDMDIRTAVPFEGGFRLGRSLLS